MIVCLDQVVEARQLGGYGGSPSTCGPRQVCCRAPQASNYQASTYAAGTCGRRNPLGVTGRIKTLPYVDGDAEFGEYPWQVAILRKEGADNVYVCGGTLVGQSHVVTAAHCLKGSVDKQRRRDAMVAGFT